MFRELWALLTPLPLSPRAEELFQNHQQAVYRRTDRLFAGLMVLQWLAAIAAACWISPLAWAGTASNLHPHVWAAVFLGGAITSLPVFLALTRAGAAATRLTIGVAQLLMSGLLIHLTGGRIETHFHVFGSLAFLAFYRDWRVFIPATLVVAADHILRGAFWPQSVFGVLAASPWRSIEHAGWVLFEDTFLTISCLQGVREMREIAAHQAKQTGIQVEIESQVERRTIELTDLSKKLTAATLAAEVHARRTRLIVDSAYDAFVAIDSAGLIVDWNPQASATFGWPRDEALGRVFAETIIAPWHREAHTRGLARFLKTGEGPTLNKLIEITALHRDGREFPVELTISPVGSGPTSMFCAFVHDITERKNAEASLTQRAKQLAQSNAELEQFAYVASHDLREPLRMVQSFCGLLQDRYADKLDERANKYIHFAVDGAARMQHLVDDLLEFSRVGRNNERFESVRLDDVVRQAVTNLEAPIVESGATIELDLLPTIHGDAMRLRQVFQNLIGNAIKFRGSEPPAIKVTACREGGAWRITVADNGIGIAPKHVPRLFVVFQRLHTKDEYPGTGIGLALCKRIVELHGGRIWLDSQPGRGTSIHFCLLPAEDSSFDLEQEGAECILQTTAI